MNGLFKYKVIIDIVNNGRTLEFKDSETKRVIETYSFNSGTFREKEVINAVDDYLITSKALPEVFVVDNSIVFGESFVNACNKHGIEIEKIKPNQPTKI